MQVPHLSLRSFLTINVQLKPTYIVGLQMKVGSLSNDTLLNIERSAKTSRSHEFEELTGLLGSSNCHDDQKQSKYHNCVDWKSLQAQNGPLTQLMVIDFAKCHLRNTLPLTPHENENTTLCSRTIQTSVANLSP